VPIGLDSLQLSEERKQAAREVIQRNAYFKWQNAGCPDGDGSRFWKEAEFEWIEFNYVPDRAVEYASTSQDGAAKPADKPAPRSLLSV
jgi:hypothetical protein